MSQGADKENLLNSPELLYLVIIPLILMTLMCDSEAILQGEIRCWSLLGAKGLIQSRKSAANFLHLGLSRNLHANLESSYFLLLPKSANIFLGPSKEKRGEKTVCVNITHNLQNEREKEKIVD